MPAFLARNFPLSVQADGWVLGGSGDNPAHRSQQGTMWIQRRDDSQEFMSRHYDMSNFRQQGKRAVKLSIDLSIATTTEARSTADKAPPPGRATAWFSDPDGQRLTRTTLLRLDGSEAQQHADTLLPLPEAASQLNVTVHTWKNDFKVSTDSLVVSLLEPSPLYRLYLVVLAAGWLCIALLMAKVIQQRLPIRTVILLILTTGFLLTGVSLSEAINSNVILPAYQKAAVALYGEMPEDGFLLYKTGHAAVFFALACLLMVSARQLQRSRLELFLILVAFAIATEGLQLNFLHRTPRWQDILVDLAGIAIAGGLIALYPQAKRLLRCKTA